MKSACALRLIALTIHHQHKNKINCVSLYCHIQIFRERSSLTEDVRIDIMLVCFDRWVNLVV